eukprot:UN22509
MFISLPKKNTSFKRITSILIATYQVCGWTLNWSICVFELHTWFFVQMRFDEKLNFTKKFLPPFTSFLHRLTPPLTILNCGIEHKNSIFDCPYHNIYC